MANYSFSDIVIGTRGSKLALWQANFALNSLKAIYPLVNFSLKIIETKGDRLLDTALYQIGDKGLFTKEIENELLIGNIHLAVHSLKDLQTDLPNGLKISAVAKRHNPCDVIIAKEKGLTIHSLKKQATLATSSIRRIALLKSLRPDINIIDLRGNITTRIKKFEQGNFDYAILACAGVERLGLTEYISSYIPTDIFIPAVGQGALAIESRADDYVLNEMLNKINDQKTEIEVSNERAFLKELGGGCKTPIAAYAQIIDNSLIMEGLVAKSDGSKIFKEKIKSYNFDLENTGKTLAQLLLAKGADKLLI